jgi:hypothetical protein
MPKITKNNPNPHGAPVGAPPANPNPLVLINVILDKSGSMSSIAAATMSGFNEYKNDQIRQNGDTFLSLTLFDSGAPEVRHVVAPIAKVADLDAGNYRPNGGTALYDAIGYTIQTLQDKIDKLPRVPDEILYVILTDGEENASREFTLDRIKELIAAQEKTGATFVYLGANQDAWQVGMSMGIAGANTMSYCADPDSMKKTMVNLSKATTNYRMASAAMPASDGGADRSYRKTFWEEPADGTVAPVDSATEKSDSNKGKH